jgi:phage head maturation protease
LSGWRRRSWPASPPDSNPGDDLGQQLCAYEQEAVVLYRGQTWREVFERNAFRGIENHTRTVRVNRNHDRLHTVGKVIRFDPHHRQGLLANVRIAQTPLGDETLSLAAEDCLSASVAFSVPTTGERLDHRNRIRRITRADIDHIALVEAPAYEGARVLATA